MEYSTSLNTIYVRMWEHGHSFEEIRGMSLEDMGIVLAVWQQKARIEKKKNRLRANRKGKKGG